MAFKKRFAWSLLLMFTVVVMLAACGGDNSEEATATGDASSNDKEAQGEVRGVTDDEIVIGNIVAHTGPQAIYGLLADSAQVYFDYVNENGGVNGRKIKFVTLDGEYQPAKAVQQAQRIIEEEEAFLMLASDCTSCHTATQDFYAKNNVMNVMASTGGNQFTSPPNDLYLGSSIANYRIETKVFYDFAVNELNAKRIALVYQNDDFGQEGFEATKEIRDNYDAEIVIEVPVIASSDDFSTEAQKVKEADVDTVIMISTPNPAAKLKQEFHKIGLTDVNYIVSSVGGNDASLYQLAGEEVWEGTYSAGTIPMPDDPEFKDSEAMQRYVELFGEAYPDDNNSGFPQVGYAAAEVLVEILERAGDELTNETFKEAAYTLDQWDEGIYAGVTFNEDNHYGLTSLFITRAQGGQIEKISETINFDPTTGDILYK